MLPPLRESRGRSPLAAIPGLEISAHLVLKENSEAFSLPFWKTVELRPADQPMRKTALQKSASH